jgi:hypothetical protein
MVKSQAEAKTESTNAGEQHVIPGAEKVSDAEVAKRKAGQPLKPKVRQKPSLRELLEGLTTLDPKPEYRPRDWRDLMAQQPSASPKYDAA